MKLKLNFNIFGKISNAVAIAMELKKFLALWESCKSLAPLFIECRKAVQVPLVNLLIEFRKKVAEAEALAAETENKNDDMVIGWLADIADGVLAFFHADDDYARLSELDDAAKPDTP